MLGKFAVGQTNFSFVTYDNKKNTNRVSNEVEEADKPTAKWKKKLDNRNCFFLKLLMLLNIIKYYFINHLLILFNNIIQFNQDNIQLNNFNSINNLSIQCVLV